MADNPRPPDAMPPQRNRMRPMQRVEPRPETSEVSLWVSRTMIQWESGLPKVEVGDQVTVRIERFGIDGSYEVVDVDPFGITLSPLHRRTE